MIRRDEIYESALQGRTIPLLTLDHRWHRLFTQTQPSPRIKVIEQELNELLRRQGKLTTDVKAIKLLRRKLRSEVMEIVGGLNGAEPGPEMNHKLDENERLLGECSDKINAYDKELEFLPEQIEEVNYELMLETMNICYQLLKDNTAEIEALEAWIDEARLALKKNSIRKEEKEIMNQDLYTYMHAIFGAHVIEIFDMKYRPKKNPRPQVLPEESEQDKEADNVES